MLTPEQRFEQCKITLSSVIQDSNIVNDLCGKSIYESRGLSSPFSRSRSRHRPRPRPHPRSKSKSKITHKRRTGTKINNY